MKPLSALLVILSSLWGLCMGITSGLPASSVPSGGAAPAAGPVVVLVTGASSGIGRSVVQMMAQNPKYKVWASMRTTEFWDLPVQDNMRITQLDVTDDESVSNAVDRVIAEDGKVDIVINSAGYGVFGALEAVSIKDAKDLFDVNVWGVVRVLQSVLPHMRKARRGHIINLSSIAGIRGIPGLEYYTASKFALEGLMDSFRYSMHNYNIHVTNVNAGPVRTPFRSRIVRGAREISNDSENFLSSLTNSSVEMLGRRMESDEAQTSEEVAQVIANIAVLGEQATKFTDVPFNIGSGKPSQAIIEAVRKQPTGWGGIYTDILLGLPRVNKPTTSAGTKGFLSGAAATAAFERMAQMASQAMSSDSAPRSNADEL